MLTEPALAVSAFLLNRGAAGLLGREREFRRGGRGRGARLDGAGARRARLRRAAAVAATTATGRGRAGAPTAAAAATGKEDAGGDRGGEGAEETGHTSERRPTLQILPLGPRQLV